MKCDHTHGPGADAGPLSASCFTPFPPTTARRTETGTDACMRMVPSVVVVLVVALACRVLLANSAQPWGDTKPAASRALAPGLGALFPCELDDALGGGWRSRGAHPQSSRLSRVGSASGHGPRASHNSAAGSGALGRGAHGSGQADPPGWWRRSTLSA